MHYETHCPRRPRNTKICPPNGSRCSFSCTEILEERYGRRSTIITSQIPVDKWHELIGDPTYADGHPRSARP
jgi:hypothetical protein